MKEIIEEQLRSFIYEKKAQIYALKGKWGVGKTYFWKEFVKRDEFCKIKYVYVSLFGLKSIDDLKKAVLTRTYFHEHKKLNSLLNENIKITKTTFKLPLINIEVPQISNIWDTIAFELLSGKLICFDDIERRNATLNLDEFFGFCDYLKEEKECKILFILNDAKESEQDSSSEMKVYEKYREKVIDKELIFDPDIDDALHIAFNDEKYTLLIKKCKELTIKNIRILNKIKLAFNDIYEYYKSCSEEQIQGIADILVLGMASYLKEYKEIPFENLKRFPDEGYSAEYLEKFAGHISNITEEKYDEIMFYIENGYVRQEKLEEVIRN